MKNPPFGADFRLKRIALVKKYRRPDGYSPLKFEIGDINGPGFLSEINR